MKAIILFLCLVAVHVVTSKSELCFNSKEECHSTNYQSYVECIRRRQKRSTDCDNDCDSGNCIDICNECDCDSCNYSSCTSSCSNCCSSCCSNYVPCHTNHCCHKTCHTQCSTASCRSSCRKNCFNSVRERTEGDFPISYNHDNISISNLNKPNITTIIHLNNVINNTNVVDIPIVLNNTNNQNISLYSEESSDQSTSTEKCCTVISPRQCVSTPTPRCFHYRSKQCGPFCTAAIVHKEQQQICSVNYPGAQPICSQQIMYIPQPQPKCTYQSFWPYVSCGIQKQEACYGCYSHYLNGDSNNYLNCPSQCYDDGFGAMGSFYRQGPVYRPWYSHAPCYECLGYPNPYANSYGGLGYQNIGGYPGPVFVQNVPLQQDNESMIPVLNLNNPIESQFNQTGDLMVELGPINQSLYENQNYDGRLPREVEIEVNYEPSSNAQAEVKIKDENVTDKPKES